MRAYIESRYTIISDNLFLFFFRAWMRDLPKSTKLLEGCVGWWPAALVAGLEVSRAVTAAMETAPAAAATDGLR